MDEDKFLKKFYKNKINTLIKMSKIPGKPHFTKNVDYEIYDAKNLNHFSYNSLLNKDGEPVPDYSENGYSFYSSFNNSKNHENFAYRINSEGFRCDNFDKNKEYILISGCSNAFGFSLPENFMYSKMLENQKYSIYNLSFPGHGINLIILNVLKFIFNYKKPKAIILDLPPFNRDIAYDDESNQYCSQTLSINDMFNTKDFFKDNALSYNEPVNFYKQISMINILESICESLGIELFFRSWDEETNSTLSEFNFKYQIKDTIIDQVFLKQNNKKHPAFKYFEEYEKTLDADLKQYIYNAADGKHPGIFWNYINYIIFNDLLVKKNVL